MATSQSGARAGGKIVTNRRRQRLSATPYERPPLRSPNWFSAVVVPSARAIASGAGKIFASIFSESSSSEEEDYASEDDIVNDNFPEFPCNQENTIDENNAISSKMVQYRQDPRLSVWRTATKKIIEQLIMKETFTSIHALVLSTTEPFIFNSISEECDRVIRVLNSRVIDWSPEAGEKSSVAGSPRNKLDCENVDIFEKAVQDAKRWCQEKKAGLNSLIELPRGSSILNPKTLNDVDTGGSPVDVARSYMKTRSPWASSGINTELKTLSGLSVKLFQEETLYSTGHYSVTSSEKRRSFASGSWNIQEELRRVRSKATEDMLCSSPSTKIDPSHSTIAQIRMGSATPSAGEEVFDMGERMTEPQPLRLHRPIDALVDAGASSLAALKRQVREASEALSSKPETSVSENIEVPEAVLFQADDEFSASKINHPSSPEHTEAPPSDVHKISSSPELEVTKTVERETANRLPSSQVSLWIGNQMVNHASYAKNIVNVEGNCELLSEAYMEVPIVTESHITASGYRVQYEERALEERRQLERKTIRYNRRRSRGRGK